MKAYNVIMEIELDSDSPLEAAKTAETWLRDGGFQYYVQDVDSRELFSVDLSESDDDAVLPIKNYEPLIK